MDSHYTTVEQLRQDILDNNLQAKAIIQVIKAEQNLYEKHFPDKKKRIRKHAHTHTRIMQCCCCAYIIIILFKCGHIWRHF